MFLSPWWSVAILIALVLMYIVIRIKHGGPLLAPYRHIDDWWLWLRTVVYDFRSWVASAGAGIAIALPDLAVAILPVDMTWLVGENYAKVLTGALTAYLAINRAFSTTPPAEAD